MTSKLVSDRERSTFVVVSLCEGHATATGVGLGKTLFSVPAPTAGAAPAPNPSPPAALGAECCRAIARYLSKSIDDLVLADRAHERELDDDGPARERRDSAHATLRKTISSLRGVVEGSFGAAGLEALHLTEPCPKDGLAAVAYARSASAALGDATLALPEPTPTGSTFDRAEAARVVTRDASALRTRLEELAVEESAAKRTLAAKTAAMESHDHAFRWSVDTMLAWWAAAGMSELCDKLKSELRERASSDEPEVPVDPAAPTDPSATPADGTAIATPTKGSAVEPTAPVIASPAVAS